MKVEVEQERGTHVVWVHTPPNSTYLPCRLSAAPVDHAFYLAAYEASRERSPFNQRLYARRNRPGELILLRGNTRFCRTASGVTSRDLDPFELCRSLGEEFELSPDLIEAWVVRGALTASFEPARGPKPPPVTRQTPSLR